MRKCWLIVIFPIATVALTGGLAADTVQAGEASREHVEVATGSRHEYSVSVGGAVDGPMTRDPIGYGGWNQTFEPNREVVMTNLGPAVVENPWLSVNGEGHTRNLQELVEHVVTPDMSEGEKARALWEWHRRHRFHSSTDTAESSDAVKVYNVYGYTLCGNDAVVIADLWRAAGLQVRAGKPQGHCTSEVFYDGRWHLLDGDENIICLLSDNKTIACEDEIIHDHDLMKRTHTYGILRADSRRTDETSAALHCHEEREHGQRNPVSTHTMDFTLRPGESLIWRWSNVGKWYGTDKYGSWERVGERVANGRLEYGPDFGNETHREPIGVAKSGEFSQTPDKKVVFRPVATGGAASLMVPLTSAYVIVGGEVAADFTLAGTGDSARIDLSFDQQEWTRVWEAKGDAENTANASLDEHFPRTGKARYGCWLRFSLPTDRSVNGAALEGFQIGLDLQMAPLTLPALQLGDNRIAYTDVTPEPHEIVITHRWVECSDWSRPPTPSLTYPPDGNTTASTRPHFRWERVVSPDGTAIVDYQFQLSEHADMQWVLSPNFDKLIARTAYRGAIPDVLAEGYEPPYDGLLNPTQTYYWRARARDERGVWGPWSEARSFVPQGPGVPVELALEVDRQKRSGVLRWRPNPAGTPPDHYEVYGCDERGFTPSREPYDVVHDGTKPKRYPANLIASVRRSELLVLGPELDAARFNKSYYRIVAVDAEGVRSGPTPCVEAPHPWFISAPPEEAKPGAPFSYKPVVAQSAGHLVAYTANNTPYNFAFRYGDALTFSLVAGPEWLKISPGTGQLTGVAPEGGAKQCDIQLLVSNGAGVSDTQRFTLRSVP